MHKHKAKCEQNYHGTSSMIEIAAAERIWARSLDHGFRYTSLIADGDSKQLAHLKTANCYGRIEVAKIEKVEKSCCKTSWHSPEKLSKG